MNLSFGFSLAGMIACLLPLLPKIVETVDVSRKNGISKTSTVPSLIEKGSRYLLLFLLIFTVSGKESPIRSFHTALMLSLLLCYYSCWVVYLVVEKNRSIKIALALLPTLYLIFVELWLVNYIALVPTLIYGVANLVRICREEFFLS